MSVDVAMNSGIFSDYFRCPADIASFRGEEEPFAASGFFRFAGLTCYGPHKQAKRSSEVYNGRGEVSSELKVNRSIIKLPFDPAEVVENLRCERYLQPRGPSLAVAFKSVIRGGYYLLRPLLATPVRKHLQRAMLRNRRTIPFPSWPLDRTADRLLEELMSLVLQLRSQDVPFVWFWPEGKSACVTLTHDVETTCGLNFCSALMNLNDSRGIKSAFQLVPEKRYKSSECARDEMASREFEVNVHDWNHDGHLFADFATFLERTEKINATGAAWGAEGFRAGALYRNSDWLKYLKFRYDMSIPNAAHLEPQFGGCCTLMPYFVGNILEIPVTMTQDYSLFHILNEYSTDLWKRELDTVLEAHGMASFIVHPDYIIHDRERSTYTDLLDHLSVLRDERNVWIAKPSEINRWWRQRAAMCVVRDSNSWSIEGPGSDQARLAFAQIDGEKLRYSVPSASGILA
jgi:hypothetical protein